MCGEDTYDPQRRLRRGIILLCGKSNEDETLELLRQTLQSPPSHSEICAASPALISIRAEAQALKRWVFINSSAVPKCQLWNIWPRRAGDERRGTLSEKGKLFESYSGGGILGKTLQLGISQQCPVSKCFFGLVISSLTLQLFKRSMIPSYS